MIGPVPTQLRTSWNVLNALNALQRDFIQSDWFGPAAMYKRRCISVKVSGVRTAARVSYPVPHYLDFWQAFVPRLRPAIRTGLKEITMYRHLARPFSPHREPRPQATLVWISLRRAHVLRIARASPAAVDPSSYS